MLFFLWRVWADESVMWKHFLRWALLGLEIEKCFLFSQSLLLLTVLTYFKVIFEYLFNESVESVHKTHLWCVVSQKNRQTTVVLSSVELLVTASGKTHTEWFVYKLNWIRIALVAMRASCHSLSHKWQLVLVINWSKRLNNYCWTWLVESKQSECFLFLILRRTNCQTNHSLELVLLIHQKDKYHWWAGVLLWV